MGKQQLLHRKARGLYTNFNPSQVPEGGFSRLENCYISRPDIISKSRGFGRYGDSLSSAPDALWEYKNTLLTLDGTSIKYDSDGAGTWAAWSGTFSPPDSTHKIHAVETRGNLYFTTANYPYRNDAIDGTPKRTGVLQGLSIDPDQITFQSSGGWLGSGKYVAYRYCFVREDASGRLIFGAPSPRQIVTHTEGADRAVTFKVLKREDDNDPTTDWLYVYRTKQSDTVAALGERYYLAGKQRVSDSAWPEETWGSDTLADDFLTENTELYTNPTREGEEAANLRPPYAKDIALYKGYLFLGNVRQAHSVTVKLTDELTDSETITIARGTETETYTAKTTPSAATDFQIHTGGTTTENIRDTCLALCWTVSKRYATSSRTWWAKYTSDVDEDAGEVTIVAGDYGTTAINVSCSASATGAKFDPDLNADEADSYQDAALNGLYYSKFEEPDAVPVGNILTVGSADSPIERVLALRKSVMILKEEGVWELSGDTDRDFRIEELDATTKIDAPETARILNNGVYFSSNQGVVRADGALGVSILSVPVELDLKKIQGFTNYEILAHGVAYESERQYWLWVPESSTDTYATIAYVYNYLTDSWSIRRKNCAAAHVLQSQDTLYCAHAVDSYVLAERKSLTGLDDFVDELLSTTVSAVTETTASDGSTVNVVTCSYSYTGADMQSGWLFKYGDDEAVVTDYVDNGDGTYTLTLSDMLTLPSTSGSTDNGGFFDLLCLLGVSIMAPTATMGFSAQLGIPIESTITWLPCTTDNPSSLKHWLYFSIDFEENWSFAHEFAFRSNFEGYEEYLASEITSDVPGWGTGGYGEIPWGAPGDPAVPVATYIPRQYQRAQWIQPTLRHRRAKEKFDIISAALTFRPIGERGVRSPK